MERCRRFLGLPRIIYGTCGHVLHVEVWPVGGRVICTDQCCCVEVRPDDGRLICSDQCLSCGGVAYW